MKPLFLLKPSALLICAVSLFSIAQGQSPGTLYIEAESFSSMSGIQTEATGDVDGIENVSFINNGDYCVYAGVELAGHQDIKFRVASPKTGGSIEVRVGGVAGRLLGVAQVPDTNGFQNWTTVSTSLDQEYGRQDLYLVFKGGEGFLFNLNWFEISNPQLLFNTLTLEAESYTSESGTSTSGGGELTQVTEIHDGDWLLFEDVDFGRGMVKFEARARLGWDEIGRGGWIEVRLDGPSGELLGRCLVVGVDISSEWQTRMIAMPELLGVRDICLLFKADSPDTVKLFELDWIQFSDEIVRKTGNPVIEHLRTADPSVHVWDHYDGDKIWMYASHDMPDATDYASMDGYHVFSTNDLKNWTDHGEVLHSRDVPWGHKEGGYMWAPDANYKDGKYYFYFPHKEDTDQSASNSPFRIGVAISDHPAGPFIPEPNYIPGTIGTDPACFIDDDGQAYLYFGSHDMARLKPNMTEFDPTFPGSNSNGVRKVDLRNAPPITTFMEGAWMHKYGDQYIYSWKQRVLEDGIQYDAHYAVGDSPVGTFDYVGVLNRTPKGAQNHHSIVEIQGQWYFFYHVGGAGPAQGSRRMVCVAELQHNEDGTINLINMNNEGVEVLDLPSVFSVVPQDYQGGIRNPMKGFRSNLGRFDLDQDPYATLLRHYIPWNAIENDESDTIQKIKDYCDAEWQGLESAGRQVIPRVYLDWDEELGNEFWPADLTDGDYTSEAFKQRMVRLIHRLGECWDNDPRVAWVQLGIIGRWGEHHHPEPTEEIQILMGDALTEAFQNKRVLVRRFSHFTDYEVGIHWDSWAHPSQADQADGIEDLNTRTGRWLTHPIEGEVAYDWGDPQTLPGIDPEDSLSDPAHLKTIVDSVHRLHASALGWIANYDKTDPAALAGASELQKALGYRFDIERFSSVRSVEPGGDLDFSFVVRNTGSAPIYGDWLLEISLLDAEGQFPVWRKTLDSVDISNWLPGDDWSADLGFYLAPPRPYEISAAVPLPGDAELPPGIYTVALSIVDPLGRQPSVRFAVENYLAGGRHPFGRVAVGVAPEASPAVDSASFVDLQSDAPVEYLLQPRPAAQAARFDVNAASGTEFMMQAEGLEPNRTYILQHSSDLKEWTAVDVVDGSEGQFDWLQPVEDQAFFRLLTR
jgi:hypothetical protein